MPLPRQHQNLEHPSSSHAKWGGEVKVVVSPEMAPNPDQKDQWKVSGVKRSFAKQKDAQKTAEFLKTDPPKSVKAALSQGQSVDPLLPNHLQKLPRWGDVHGVNVPGKGKAVSERYQRARQPMAHLVRSAAFQEAMDKAKEALECGCIDKIEEARDALHAVLHGDVHRD